jgi:hypothetical protein
MRNHGSRQGWRRAVVAVVERAIALSVEKTVGMYAGELQAHLDKSNLTQAQVKHAHSLPE